jgi:hypothetical protein
MYLVSSRCVYHIGSNAHPSATTQARFSVNEHDEDRTLQRLPDAA